jgi:HlyD family secretion protein
MKYFLLKRKRLLITLAILALFVTGAGLGARALFKPKPETLRTETVDRGSVEVKVTETGTIEPLKKVEVKSKVAGRITKLYVQEGSRVRKGQILVDIDPTEINSQVAQMQAQLDGARARYEQAKGGATYQVAQTSSGIRQYEEALRAAQARLRTAMLEDRAQPDLIQSDVAGAAASLKASRDSLTLLKNSTQPQDRVQAQTNFDDAKMASENAQRNLDRQQGLLVKGYVSAQDVETAKATLASARARSDQAQKHLDLLGEQERLEIADANSRVAQAQATFDRAQANRSQIPIKTQDVLSAKAAVEQAKAQLQSALSSKQQDKIRRDAVAEAHASVVQIENQLREIQVAQRDTRLLATMDGTVTRRYIEQGELITSGTSSFSSGTPVLQVADLSEMLVKMTVNEVDVNRITVGLPVEIQVDGAKNAKFTGKVRTVSPAAISNDSNQGGGGNNNVIRFAVEVLVDHPDARLKPGMSAKCDIVIGRKKNALRLPSDTVEGDSSTATVQVLEPNAKKDAKPVFKPRKITVGLHGDAFVEIVSGLKAGEKVKPGKFKGPSRKAIDMFN